MYTDMLNYLCGRYDKDDEWNTHVAIYWFANDYHGGQSHPLYEVLCQSGYRPSCLASDIEDEDEVAQSMYEDLVCVYNV